MRSRTVLVGCYWQIRHPHLNPLPNKGEEVAGDHKILPQPRVANSIEKIEEALDRIDAWTKKSL